MRHLLAAAFLLFAVAALAQVQEQKKPVPMSPTARLNAAKTVFVKNGGGNEIPYNVISSAVEGWGRFLPVDAPEKADIIIEVTAPEENSGMSVSSSTTRSAPAGKQNESSVTSTRNLTVTQIKLLVYDGKSKIPLWSGTEQPKSGMKQKTREDHLVEAAQRLFTRFHDRVEPPAQ